MISQNIKNKLKLPFISLFSFAFVLNVCTGCKENEAPLEQVDFKTCSWNDIKVRCDKLENDDITEDEFCALFTYDSKPITTLDDFVGKERIVEVNKQPHRVRVIDTLHDTDENRNPLALTFEFANLISDESGYSLAWQWNDCNDHAAYEFINSSIRKILNGTGGREETVYCASKESYCSWDERYTNVTVLSMLPSDLQEVIKPTLKSVLHSILIEYTKTYSYRTRYTDKLFLLSNVEIGDIKAKDEHRGCGFGNVYKYYEKQTGEYDSKRIKTQVNYEEEYDPYYEGAEIPRGEGQVFDDPVTNYAGNNRIDHTTGVAQSSYLLSSGYLANQVLTVFPSNGDIGGGSAEGSAYGVAPAFCI